MKNILAHDIIKHCANVGIMDDRRTAWIRGIGHQFAAPKKPLVTGELAKKRELISESRLKILHWTSTFPMFDCLHRHVHSIVWIIRILSLAESISFGLVLDSNPQHQPVSACSQRTTRWVASGTGEGPWCLRMWKKTPWKKRPFYGRFIWYLCIFFGW